MNMPRQQNPATRRTGAALVQRVAAASLLALALTAPQAGAHHSFSAEFDINKKVHLEGEVVMMEWVNPHSWLHVKIVNEAGEEEVWRVEGGAPSALLRRGWNRNSLPPGTKVIVDGYQARDGAPRMNAADIVFPDGRKLNLGSSQPDELQRQ